MRILYVTTSFPVYSETFLQREVRAMADLGVDLKILSLHHGDEKFDDMEIDRFSKWELWTLIWKLPIVLVTRFSIICSIASQMVRHRPGSGLNFWENLLGFGAAVVRGNNVKVVAPDVIHAVWSSGPGAFGWLASKLSNIPYTMGAHAYDVFENGGDWLLRPKLREAMLIHTSTESAASRLRSITSNEKVHVIRRGMGEFPFFKPLRKDRNPIRIACIARLVEKKGFPQQMAIYKALADAGVGFEAQIVGEGPWRDWITRSIQANELGDRVKLLGRLPQDKVLEVLGWADILIHSGIVARNGDRDGLPNVIPEAMAVGAVVLASPVSGVVEAIEDEVNGLLLDVEDAEAWVNACRRIQSNDEDCERFRNKARDWVDREFVAKQNTGKLLTLIAGQIKS